MKTTITVDFDSVDEAERAISRMRHSIRELRVLTGDEDFGSKPADAPYSASVYYPWRVNMSGNELNSMPKELGSRVLYTSDLLGLPIYQDGAATVQFVLPAAEAERARALLVNSGGHRIRLDSFGL